MPVLVQRVRRNGASCFDDEGSTEPAGKDCSLELVFHLLRGAGAELRAAINVAKVAPDGCPGSPFSFLFEGHRGHTVWNRSSICLPLPSSESPFQTFWQRRRVG